MLLSFLALILGNNNNICYQMLHSKDSVKVVDKHVLIIRFTKSFHQTSLAARMVKA
jgi:hypothetical protein